MSEYGNIYRFGNHKVEMALFSTGYMSPWHMEKYNSEHDKPPIVTADVGHFMRVDDGDIYKLYPTQFYCFTEDLKRISENYDYYPAEMENEFQELFKSENLKKEPDL